MSSTVKRIYWSSRHTLGLRASRLGEQIGIDALVYNSVVMDLFGAIADQAAPILARGVVRLYPSVQTVADVGCGTGHFVKAFQDLGVNAIGFERSAYARRYAHNRLSLRVESIDLEEEKHLPRVDLAMSLEVAEHLPPALGDVLVRLMAVSAPVVVFSAAQPGQGGNGHINEQPVDYWITRFAANGLLLRERQTHELRELLRGATRAPWLSRNLMAFERADFSGSLARAQR